MVSRPVHRLNQTPNVLVAVCYFVAFSISACESLTPEAATLTPTWAYSAPTLEPSPAVVIGPPSERAPNSDYTGPGQTSPTAAALPWDSDLPPIEIASSGNVKTVQITLRDSTILVGDLHEHPSIQTEQASTTQRLPGVLFLGAPPDLWGIFPAQLRDAGFTVLVMDMQDRYTSADFVDVIQAFSEVGSVHPGHIGVVGTEDGADQALIGCAVEYLCDVVALLSPLGRDTLVNMMVQYNPRPLLIAASRGDTVSFEAAQAIQAVVTGPNAGHFLDGTERGTNLLNDRNLSRSIIEWMRLYLAE